MIGCDVNKPVKLSLHSENVNIGQFDLEFFNITRDTNYWQKEKFKIFPITWFSLQKIPLGVM